MNKVVIALSLLALATTASALELSTPIHVPAKKTIQSPNDKDNTKYVTLMRYRMSDREQRYFLARQTQPKTLTKPHLATSTRYLPPKMNLGMNEVPVLDQGRHGSCVTFAVTAAIDAVLKRGDYISQLCSLQLGNYLEKNGYVYSGWNGSYAPLVLNQFTFFGVINKENEKAKKCGTLEAYPINDERITGQALSPSKYKKSSQRINHLFYWRHLFGGDEVFDVPNKDPNFTETVLQKVKEGLVAGHRITFATFIIIPVDSCSVGACATHNERYDTWAVTSEIQRVPYDVGGHEMVIYGYDDDAIAFDNEGNAHKGLLTVRNSWGDDVGDHGDYYITYDYFKKYVIGAEEIISRLPV